MTPEPLLVDESRRDDVEHYLIERSWLSSSDLPITIATAGAGNMNVTLRIIAASGRTMIVKQGRPWVAKYPQIPAPIERTRVEAAFYDLASAFEIARMMPALLHVDPDNHLLVLEDIGTQGDLTSIYRGGALEPRTLTRLLDWLARLAEINVPADRRDTFANRAMRALNHEHIFQFPLRVDNGLDLDGITPGLHDAADALKRDRAYGDAVSSVGLCYLADGDTLVHGDYFPGSWLNAADGVRIIDPEFCFLGDPEFDCGVVAAHLLMAGAGGAALAQVSASVSARNLRAGLVHQYAGVEIMRRLIGVAQLPLSLDVAEKRALLALSRRFVLQPGEGLTC